MDLQEIERGSSGCKVGPQKSRVFPPLSLVHLLDDPLPHRVRIPHQHPDVPMTTDRTTARSVQNLLHWTYETPRSTHLRFLLAPVCLIVLAVLAEGKAAAQTFETVEVRSLYPHQRAILGGRHQGRRTSDLEWQPASARRRQLDTGRTLPRLYQSAGRGGI